ncbi:TPA_asm: hypothetical protein vir524_00036 [Caudoviricetes sp. vir524]|nr:TPA_asm: hypothetical protein vir524_00036 [Caudoviricetes sp. vir524]
MTNPKKVNYEDDPALTARFRARMTEIRHTDAESLTIAERLMRRAFDQRMTIPFPVDEGEPIPVEVRMPLAAELEELASIYVANRAARTDKGRRDLNQRTCELLASLCIDESLDEGFFDSGALTVPDLYQIIFEILLENRRRITSAGSFRPESSRGGPVPAEPEPGKVPP